MYRILRAHCFVLFCFFPFCRLQLATLYVQLGHADDALVVLESDPNQDKGDGELEDDKVEEISEKTLCQAERREADEMEASDHPLLILH